MCDTFVVLPPFTSDGSVIFGKNSDREPNEAQALEFRPAHTYPAGRTVKCTYLEIPQARETRAVLLCRPFWMWGAEMGANEKGVVIGNEAVFTRMPLDRKGGLTGMDLLRLSLERADTAEQAVETVIQLLADHGQGGICGYEDKRMSYHNSFICADPHESWVLETAGPLWARRKVGGFASISNGLTIGEDFDACHPGAVRIAQKKGWLRRGEIFSFARCFSDRFYTTFSACRARQARSLALIRTGAESEPARFDVPSAFLVLRDHGEGPYLPDTHLLGNRICAHAANRLARNATQTTGSLVAHLKTGQPTHWATGTSAPCIGIFKPVWFGPEPLAGNAPPPGGTFQPDALWWRHERLHRAVLLDYTARLEAYRADRDALEREFLKKAAEVVGRDQEAAFTREAFARAREATDRWAERVRTLPIQRRPRWHYHRYWQSRNRKAGIEISPA